MTPKVDVLVVLYNSSRFLGPFLQSLRTITFPVTIYFLDNGSGDETPQILEGAISQLPFRVYFLRSLKNNGFAHGMNLLARQGSGQFMFMLNPDTELLAGCLERLLARVEADHRIAICEARQQPREHPKTYNSDTGETSWCTGAAILVRRQAFEQVGGFDSAIFFMYCEDVDLSWKFWLSDWKCVYVPDAVIRHYTQDLLPGKKRTVENYFSFRNSLFLFYRYGNWSQKAFLWSFLGRRFLSRKYSIRSKILYAFAFGDHIRYIPYLLRTRHLWCTKHHPWVRLDETSLAD